MKEEDIAEYFLSKSDFSKGVEKLVFSGRGDISFIEAVIALADETKVDLQDISKYITPEIKRKIEIEAEEKKMLKFNINDLKEADLTVFFGDEQQ
jgi:hypothetical protein